MIINAGGRGFNSVNLVPASKVFSCTKDDYFYSFNTNEIVGIRCGLQMFLIPNDNDGGTYRSYRHPKNKTGLQFAQIWLGYCDGIKFMSLKSMTTSTEHIMLLLYSPINDQPVMNHRHILLNHIFD